MNVMHTQTRHQATDGPETRNLPMTICMHIPKVCTHKLARYEYLHARPRFVVQTQIYALATGLANDRATHVHMTDPHVRTKNQHRV
jgi:hypothetical protein